MLQFSQSWACSWPIIQVSGYCFCFIYLRTGPTLRIGAGCQDLITIASLFAKFMSLLGGGRRKIKLVPCWAVHALTETSMTILFLVASETNNRCGKNLGKGECCCGEENALRGLV